MDTEKNEPKESKAEEKNNNTDMTATNKEPPNNPENDATVEKKTEDNAPVSKTESTKEEISETTDKPDESPITLTLVEEEEVRHSQLQMNCF